MGRLYCKHDILNYDFFFYSNFSEWKSPKHGSISFFFFSRLEGGSQRMSYTCFALSCKKKVQQG